MLQPNATLYVKNIDWKVKKPLLRRALYSLFTRHGKVLELIALRRDGLRGQAWVVFDDVQAATAALQAEQGFSLFGRGLVIEYAKAQSDRIAKRDGTYVPKAKRAKVQEEEDRDDDDNSDDKNDDANMQPPVEAAAPAIPFAPEAPPSKYLLAQDLPAECNELMLDILFRPYAGYKEVRAPRPGLAFIEFVDEPTATLAKNGLNGFLLTKTDHLKLTYGNA